MFDHHLMYGIPRRLHILSYDSSLTGSIAIGLDDYGRAMFFQVGCSLFSVRKSAVLCSRNTGSGHQILCEGFAALECGSCRAGSKDAQATLAEYVSNTLH